MSLVSVVYFQVEVFGFGCSLVQRSPTEYGVSKCNCEASTVRDPGPGWTIAPWVGGRGEQKLINTVPN
jgi:hypothetical protein